MPSAPLARKRYEPARTDLPARGQREVPDGAPARGIVFALGLGALAWLAILLAITF